MFDSIRVDDGVGEEETYGKNVTTRTKNVLIITNFEKKERESVEKDGNIWYKTELIDDEPWNDVLLDMIRFFLKYWMMRKEK